MNFRVRRERAGRGLRDRPAQSKPLPKIQADRQGYTVTQLLTKLSLPGRGASSRRLGSHSLKIRSALPDVAQNDVKESL